MKDGRIAISGKEAHHILDVMRLKKSDRVVTFDGTGKEYVGVIENALKTSLVVRIEEERRSPAGQAPSITLIQAIPKKEKMDYIVEKATELGVNRVIPAMTDRTIVRWDREKGAASAGRWRKIALASAKQCGRSDLPEITDVTVFRKCLASLKDGGLRLIAALSDESAPFKEELARQAVSEVIIAIGPEGDFTPDEIYEAVRAGFRLVSLGPRVLKSDTAGLFAISAINYEFSRK